MAAVRENGSTPEESLERDAKVRQVQRRLIWRIVWILAGLTAIVGVLNGWFLYRAAPAPFDFALEGSYEPHAGEKGNLSVAWDSGQGATSTRLHPTLLLDNQVIPVDGPGSTGLSFEPARHHLLALEIPSSVSAGIHAGRLIVTMNGRDASSGTPGVVEQSLAVEVVSGLWRSWFFLRNWLFVVVAVLIGAWIFCYISFPPPQGFIRFEKRYSDEFNRPDVRLRASLLGTFFPFERSRVPLSRVIPGARDCGTILFVLRGIPPILLQGGRRAVSRTVTTTPLPEENAFTECNPVEIMYPQKLFRVSMKDTAATVRFRFAEPRVLTSNQV